MRSIVPNVSVGKEPEQAHVQRGSLGEGVLGVNDNQSNDRQS